MRLERSLKKRLVHIDCADGFALSSREGLACADNGLWIARINVLTLNSYRSYGYMCACVRVQSSWKDKDQQC